MTFTKVNFNKCPDILLIQPHQGRQATDYIFQPGAEIPLNLACLSSYLEREGVTNEILDLRLYPDPIRVFKEVANIIEPKMIGISAFSSEKENADTIALVSKKENKERPIIIGGYHASALPRETLGAGLYDFLVYGEGEISLTALVKCIVNGGRVDSISGIAFKYNGQVVINPPRELISCLDSLPHPARHKLELGKYVPAPGTGNFLRLPTTGIMGSRGCPYNCNYCSKGVWGRAVRFRSPEDIVEEMADCTKAYGICDFRFYDDVLTLREGYIKKLCTLILEKGWDISWNCYSRVDTISLELLKLMKKAGCYHIKYGIEFGTEKALRLANKTTTLKQAREAVRLTKEVGIECKGNFILGIPGETEKDCLETIAFARDIMPDLASFYEYVSYPGSAFYQRDDRLSPEKVSKLVSRAYRSFYFSPRFVVQRLKRLARYPGREISLLYSGLSMMVAYFFKKRYQLIRYWLG